MNVLDLFSGIGGFSLGLERAGCKTVAFCESDPFLRRVLAEYWPHVPIYDDVRTVTADRLRADGIAADVICGGFPCQDISTAGKRAGLAGAQSGLWFEFFRLVGELRPRFVIVENTPGLLSLGMGSVLGDLAAIRYDAEWECISAGAVGAPHERDRVWILAYPDGEGEHACAVDAQVAGIQSLGHVDLSRCPDVEGFAATAPQPRLRAALATAYATRRSREWPPEPDVVRVVDGISNRMDPHRIRALGNVVVPQVSEVIGQAIMLVMSTT